MRFSLNLLVMFSLFLCLISVGFAKSKPKNTSDFNNKKVRVKTESANDERPNVAAMPINTSKFSNDKAAMNLMEYFQDSKADKNKISKMRSLALKLGGKSVPVLIEVMKNGVFPDRNRWIATFLLGQIMGKKATPFLAKFLKHPHWLLRMAALKTLLALKDKTYADLYVQALQDDSLVVRNQALENIRVLKLDEYAPNVWAMLYDKRNYYQGKGMMKRGHIIENVIKVIGDLKFDKAKTPLLKMIVKKKYADVYEAMEYALIRILGKEPPKGNQNVRRVFWERMAVASVTI